MGQGAEGPPPDNADTYTRRKLEDWMSPAEMSKVVTRCGVRLRLELEDNPPLDNEHSAA